MRRRLVLPKFVHGTLRRRISNKQTVYYNFDAEVSNPYSASIKSLEESECDSESDSDSSNEIMNGGIFSTERFPICLVQSSEMSFSQCLQKFCHMSGVHFERASRHKFATLSFDEGCEAICLL